MTEMLNELDNDIEITSENIVNPGKKKKEPLGEVLTNYSSNVISNILSFHNLIFSFIVSGSQPVHEPDRAT